MWRNASNWVGELGNYFPKWHQFFGVAVMMRLTPHPAVIQRLRRLRRVWSLHGNIDKVQLPGQICLLPDWTPAWKSVSIDMWRPSRPIFFSGDSAVGRTWIDVLVPSVLLPFHSIAARLTSSASLHGMRLRAWQWLGMAVWPDCRPFSRVGTFSKSKNHSTRSLKLRPLHLNMSSASRWVLLPHQWSLSWVPAAFQMLVDSAPWSWNVPSYQWEQDIGMLKLGFSFRQWCFGRLNCHAF